MPTHASSCPLQGVRVVEVSSFVAAPTAGLTLAQLGAEVIRIDPVGGAADVTRWPLSSTGRSLYWAGLNRGKRSAEVDLSTPAGQRLLADLVCAPGPGAGVLVSNVFGRSWLNDQTLRSRRPDLVHVQVLGRADGAPAVDYVVNAASGLPYATGPEPGDQPVNHALPAWDLLCGMQVAVAVLAGLYRRREHGAGLYATVSLEDVAAATLTTLGLLPEAHQTGRSRPAVGNAVYGTFGTDVTLADGTRLMVVAITDRQWRQLLDITECADVVAAVEHALGADFTDEGDRYRHRDVLVGLLRPWFARRSLDEVGSALAGSQVLWAPFRRLSDLAADLAAGALQPVVERRAEDGLGEMLVTSGPIRVRGEPPPRIPPAPVLGQDTADITRLVGSLRPHE